MIDGEGAPPGAGVGRGEPVYRETHTMNPTYLVLLGVLIAIYLIVVVEGIIRHNHAYTLAFAILAVVFAGVLANFWRLTFAVYSDEILFGFGLARHSFQRSTITSCEPYTIEFGNYLGYGIQIGMDRTVAYSTGSGCAVKLEVEGRKRAYAISVDNPPYVCELLSIDAPRPARR